ncbi:DUF1566 domain-containing protein [Vibrio cholerae]|uniref:DUF1566 domain-containing protein n=1 Tax=Vibrio cholerae TaxID=666 RepID=UPI0013B36D66|nr:DUF1566 domain-containing protein [Vibrio cholerae]
MKRDFLLTYKAIAQIGVLLVSVCFLSSCERLPTTEMLPFFTITVNVGAGGSISPGNLIVISGQSTSFIVTPETGYSIANVTGCNGSLNGNTYTTSTITSACKITATFNLNSYMVTAVGTEGGQITPGSISVLHGQIAQFSVVPETNYRIVEVTGCNGNLVDETFTTGAITAACTVNARFVFVPIGSLNDTGIDWCANNTTNNLDCPVIGFERQDGDFGRDAMARANNLSKVGDGVAGFDFTKISASGELLAIQDVAWDDSGSEAAGSQWSCVRDNVTGLIWEIKTSDGSLRSMNHTYTWYNPDDTRNGGDPGIQNGGACSGSNCDTHDYVQAVNSLGLCGADDWRMPSRKELLSILHHGFANPAIDSGYFPNTPPVFFWTSSPSAQNSNLARVLSFSDASALFDNKSGTYRIRLVRAEQ